MTSHLAKITQLHGPWKILNSKDPGTDLCNLMMDSTESHMRKCLINNQAIAMWTL